MYLIEQIGIILSGMMKNKLRIFLTMLGIIVGVCSVVLIVSVGLSATDVVKKYFSGTLGNNRITAYITSRNGKNFSFTYDEICEVPDKLPEFQGVLLENDLIDGKAVVDEEHYSAAVLKGVSSVYSSAYNLPITEGRFLNTNDSSAKSSAVVISSVVAENCFGNAENAIGKQIIHRDTKGVVVELVVVGVYNYTDTTGKLEKTSDKRIWSTDMFCTYEFMNEIKGIDTQSIKYPELTIITQNGADMDDVLERFEKIMKDRSDDSDYKFSCYRGYSKEEETNDTILIMVLVFVAAAALTLVVGGVSLMNTMLVMVRERTKEIGTKKALGANNANIVFQFMLESVVICLIACIIGIIAGYIAIIVLNQTLEVFFKYVKDVGLQSFLKTNNLSISINLISVLVSTAFSLLIGITFGVYPALKAAKMQITDALRYE